MAKKTTKNINHSSGCVKLNMDDAPRTLDDHPFYGLILDDDQKVFRDAIWNPDYTAVFVNAKAGSGKTLIAVATGMLLCKYGFYDGLVYVTAPTQEGKVGFLPGDTAQKLDIYNMPLYDALEKINENPERVVAQSNMETIKTGEAIVECVSHVYQRGCNFENKIIVIDESQNFYKDELKKVLTRCHDTCKVIVIGHTGQCDLYKNPEHSGFTPYLKHAEGHPQIALCELRTNHRGWLSSWADELE